MSDIIKNKPIKTNPIQGHDPIGNDENLVFCKNWKQSTQYNQS